MILRKDNKMIKLFCDNDVEFKIWEHFLTDFCILLNFYDIFSKEQKLIGTGGFGQVKKLI